MDVRPREQASRLLYPRLVPGGLLPPEGPAAPSGRRTVRDWTVDVFAFALSILVGVVAYEGSVRNAVGHTAGGLLIADLSLGVVSCVALWWRRRWPVGFGIATAVASIVSAFSVGASIIALFTVVVHRRTGVAVSVAVLGVLTGLASAVIRPQRTAFWVDVLVDVGISAIVVAWGMFVRARRQLVWTLRERAERAETEQRMLADRARLAERTRIAREMHDVLAHRISLVALHAGGLQVRPDLPADEVRETAALLRSTAQRALVELRDVIGVLREDDDGAASPAAPQPTLDDVPRLVAEVRRAGARIDLRMDVDDRSELPDTLGRDAYRIVQEALTNVAKHATGTATIVRITGAPGDGLRVDVRNQLPLAPVAATVPGSGAGLVGLTERVTLAGGTLEHGPNDVGEFVVDARLTWA